MKLRNYQENAVAAIRAAYAQGARAPLLVLPTGGGKCLAPDTPVLMFSGQMRAAKDIKQGDLLMGPDSTPRKVLSTCTGTDPMYRITPKSCGEAFECNEPHILSLVCNADISAKFKKNGIYNLSVKEYLTLPKSVKHCLKLYRVGVEFPHQETNLAPYFLGVWLGDGTSRGPIITNMEPEIEAYLYEYASRIGHYVRKVPNGDTRAWNYSLYSERRGWRNGIRGELYALNLLENKHIPRQYLINSRANRLALLAGLLDTDGYLHNNCYEIHVAHEQLGRDIVYLCRSLGFAVHVGYKKDIAGIRIGISGQGLEEIPCLVPRKKASPRKQIKDALRTGFDVEYIGRGEYCGFEIDGDRLFMLGDFTVTHNTVVFSYICEKTAAKGNRVLILAHRQELIAQASAKLSSLGLAHGVIAPKYTKAYHRPVQVASVQALIKRLHEVPAPDLIIIDEAHHAPAGSWSKVLEAYPNARVLGVTATPVRTDGLGLEGSFDALISPSVDGRRVTPKWLMDQGFLATAKVFAPDINTVDFDALKRGKGGDYTSASTAAAMDKPAIVGDAVEHYTRYAKGQPAIAFCASVKHAEQVCKAFAEAGYRAALLAGGMSSAERKALVDGLATGRVQVLCACDMVSEGTDIPVCTAAILMRPTASKGLHLQQVGRVLRPVYAEGMPLATTDQRLAAIAQGPKPYAIIIDMVGNVGKWDSDFFVTKHGFPDEEIEWKLDAKNPVHFVQSEDAPPSEEEPAIPSLANCLSCLKPFKPAPRCPHCGAARDIKSRAVIVTEGALRAAEAAEAEARRVEETERKQANKDLNSATYRAQSKAEIEALAKQYGLSGGWVASTSKRVAAWRRGKGLPFQF